MKDFVHVEEIGREREPSDGKFVNWIDKLKFIHILILWVFIIMSFGMAYYFLANVNSFLYYNLDQSPITRVIDAVYFSFVAATTTGFGDIIPMGVFKIVSIIEVIFGLLLLALVTSKLVSIKQDMILDEIYESSLNEKINRLRSSLL